MALSDYIENKAQTGVPFTVKAPAIDTLAKVDDQMRSAQQAAQIRGKREELMRQIENLKAQNDKLRARRDNIKANSLSDMSEDKIVAMAKAKGIDDKDIETWLRGRAQRSAREISLGQTRAQEEIEKTMKEQAKQDAIQAIYDAEADLVAAEKAVPDERLREKDAEIARRKNKVERLKRDFEKAYNEPWDSFKGKDKKTPDGEENGPQSARNEPQVPVVTLTEEEISVLDEPTIAKFNESTANNEDKRKIKANAQKKIRENDEADRRRKEELLGIKADLQTLGIKSASDARKILSSFEKSEDRNDPEKRGAVDRVRQFLKGEKKYKSYSELVKLLQMK